MIKDEEIRYTIIKFIAPRYKFLFFEKDEKLKSLGITVASDMPKERRVLKSKLLKARYLLRQRDKQSILKGFDLIVDDCQLTIEEIEKIISEEEGNTENNNNSESLSGKSNSSRQVSTSAKGNDKSKINFPVVKTITAKVNETKTAVNTGRITKAK